MITEQAILDTLRQIIDPEIGLNIVELGLIYNIEISDKATHVTMTLTTPGCPMHTSMVAWVETALKSLDDAKEIIVDLVWEPKWTPDMMSDEAKKQLGFTY